MDCTSGLLALRVLLNVDSTLHSHDPSTVRQICFQNICTTAQAKKHTLEAPRSACYAVWRRSLRMMPTSSDPPPTRHRTPALNLGLARRFFFYSCGLSSTPRLQKFSIPPIFSPKKLTVLRVNRLGFSPPNCEGRAEDCYLRHANWFISVLFGEGENIAVSGVGDNHNEPNIHIPLFRAF